MLENNSYSAFVKLFETSLGQMKETVETQLSGLGRSIDQLREDTKENGRKLDSALETINQASTEQATIKQQIRTLEKSDESQECKIATLQKIVWGGLGVVATVQLVLKFVG
jgi:phage I-like protein